MLEMHMTAKQEADSQKDEKHKTNNIEWKDLPALMLATPGSWTPSTASKLHISWVSVQKLAGNNGRSDRSKTSYQTWKWRYTPLRAFEFLINQITYLDLIQTSLGSRTD